MKEISKQKQTKQENLKEKNMKDINVLKKIMKEVMCKKGVISEAFKNNLNYQSIILTLNLIFIFQIWSFITKEQCLNYDVNEIKTTLLQLQQATQLSESVWQKYYNQQNLLMNQIVLEQQQYNDNINLAESQKNNGKNNSKEQQQHNDNNNSTDSYTNNGKNNSKKQQQYNDSNNSKEQQQYNDKNNSTESQKNNDKNNSKKQQQNNDKNNSTESHKNNPILPNEMIGKILENIPITGFTTFELIYNQKFSKSLTDQQFLEFVEIIFRDNTDPLICIAAEKQEILTLVGCDMATEIFQETKNRYAAQLSPNGKVYWYFYKGKSFGFSPGIDIDLNVCDKYNPEDKKRLSISLSKGNNERRIGKLKQLEQIEAYNLQIYMRNI